MYIVHPAGRRPAFASSRHADRGRLAQFATAMHYSDLNALAGSSDAARRAGIQHASTAMIRNSVRIDAYVTGSVGRTPTSIVVIARVSQKDAMRPTTSPTPLSFM